MNQYKTHLQKRGEKGEEGSIKLAKTGRGGMKMMKQSDPNLHEDMWTVSGRQAGQLRREYKYI